MGKQKSRFVYLFLWRIRKILIGTLSLSYPVITIVEGLNEKIGFYHIHSFRLLSCLAGPEKQGYCCISAY
jgi:hypothetical protein